MSKSDIAATARLGRRSAIAVEVALVTLALALLWASSLYSYLLFHSIVEATFVAVAVAVFVMAWNLRTVTENGYAVVIGTGLIFASAIQLVHALAYKGMGVFPGAEADLATQLWIGSRYLTAATFVAAPFYFGRNPRVSFVSAVYAAVTSLILAAIFWWRIFPVCYTEGAGLTDFKKISEYLIATLFVAAAGLVIWRGRDLDASSRGLFVAAMLASAAAEIAFTLYIGVYALPNLIGHLLMFLSVYFVYRGTVTTGMARTYRRLMEELAQRSTELEDLSHHLEAKVVERTAELNRVAAELETISYSISHELRSPLRAIDGFSLIALEEGRDVLSPAAVNGLERSRKAAQHMGHLIDDLLDVLKLHASELEREPVDVSALAAELVAEQPAEKPVRFEVQPGMTAEADPALLRVLLRNLIANAVKFSAREPSPLVEVWSELHDGSTRFSVRDNGVGFETEQAADLFQPFTRLVGQQEFEGTGVGLAIVQRIVALHGGRAGLDGAPGEGATAWFTLAPDA
jgi:signal transduction histidine kinase